jgi:Secreted repeat of unknown function
MATFHRDDTPSGDRRRGSGTDRNGERHGPGHLQRHPLYYFVGDKSPGQVRGQGLNEFGARWYVLSSSGSAITSAAKSAAPASTGSGSGSAYGY